jgi:hemolysin III
VLVSSTTPGENRLEKVVLDTKGEIKPRLRGWLHASAVPLSLIGGVLLIVYATSTLGRIGAVV